MNYYPQDKAFERLSLFQITSMMRSWNRTYSLLKMSNYKISRIYIIISVQRIHDLTDQSTASNSIYDSFIFNICDIVE